MNNYFDIFKLKTSYDLDIELLESNYQKIMSKLHPDNFANMGEMAADVANTKSVEYNKAYSKLKSPVYRAKHLLEINNYSIDFENVKVKSEYLMQQFDLKESFAELDGSANSYNDFLTKLEQDYDNHINALSSLFANKDYQQVKDLLPHLKFLSKLISDVQYKNSIYSKESRL